MIPADKLKQWRALCARATPAPWLISLELGGVETTQLANNGDVYGGYLWMPDFDEDDSLKTRMEYVQRDGAFIASAREAVPALLDEVESLRAALLEACTIADANIFTPTHSTAWNDAAARPQMGAYLNVCVVGAGALPNNTVACAPQTWPTQTVTGVTVDTGKPYRDKARIAEIRKLAGGSP